MKILQVNKYLYRKAGAETYFFDISKLLKDKGHQVGWWGTNEKVVHTDKFQIIEPLVKQYNFNKREGWYKDLTKAVHYIYSLEAKHKFAKVLDKFQPDIIHLHNIYHHLTPSILSVAKKRHIPIVMTVHDWNLINPNYNLYDHDQICEKKGLKALKNKCLQNSYLATLLGIIKFAWQDKTKAYQKNIDLFICPTEFVRQKLIRNGFDKNKVVVLEYPVNIKHETYNIKHEIKTNQPYILFAGRLSEEKGIRLILKIAKLLPKINFLVAGTGPLLNQLSNNQINNLTYLGFLNKEKLFEVIQNARMIIVPSLWYDPSPFAVLEAQALGKVVIGSKLGGIQNLINNNQDGILLPVNLDSLDKTAKEWSEQIKEIFNNEKLLDKIGHNASKTILQRNNPEKHYKKLKEIYLSFRAE